MPIEIFHYIAIGPPIGKEWTTDLPVLPHLQGIIESTVSIFLMNLQ